MIEIKRRQQQAAQMPAERAQKPAGGLEGLAGGECAHSTAPALKREIRAFAGVDEKRDYRAMYRAAFEYHDRHNPPRIDRKYWRTHTPGVDEMPQTELDYWEQTAHDIQAEAERHGRDPFFVSLLEAVHAELAREYERERNNAAAPF